MELSKKYIPFITLMVLLFIGFSCSDSSTSPGNETGQEFNSTANPGASAQAFLTATNFTELRVEVDYMPGYEPTQQALDNLRAFLSQRLNKTQITIDTPTMVTSGGQETYSADDIRDLEVQDRDHFTKGNSSTLYAYFLIVDGKNTENQNTVGFAYYNTSMAFFGQTIDEITSGIGAPSREKVESTVFDHEFGHIMGLVDNGSPQIENHKTQGSPHCTTDGCLMEPEIETADFFANIFDNSIPNLDALCVQDLQANGGR